MKKHWNYRVLATVHEDGSTTFSIVEVYYEDKKPVGHGAANVVGEISPNDLKTELKCMLKALKKPILREDTFPAKYKDSPYMD